MKSAAAVEDRAPVQPEPKPGALRLARNVLQRGPRVWDSVIGIVAALAVGLIALAASGVDPWAAYGALFSGAFGGVDSLSATVVQAAPLLLVGLAVGLSFESGFFNIGAGGQYGAGALAAGLIGGFLHYTAALELALMALGAIVAGMLWALGPAVLRVTTGASEVITTLMLTYVAMNLIDYVVTGPGRNGGVVNQTPPLDLDAIFPTLVSGTQLTVAALVALAFVPLTWFTLRRTTFGYSLRMVGKNRDAAQAAGISVGRIAVLALVTSGAMAGLGGMLEVSSVTLAVPQNFSLEVGFDAIAVALLAANRPVGILMTSILLGGLNAGSPRMEAQVGVSGPFVLFLEALIIATVVAMPFFRRVTRARARTRAVAKRALE